MRKQLITAAAVLLIFAAVAGAHSQPFPQTRTADDSTRQAPTFASLAGTWKSTPDQIKLTSDFDKSVWGADASSVRTVEVVVRSSGDATLKITKKVIDARGRTVPASTWIEEAQLKIGASANGIGPRVEHDTTVVSAVRLFPDDKEYRWTIEGLRVKLVTFSDGDGGTMEIRYDTPEGRGSFWEILRRDRPVGARRTSE
jgi:hypothetical protein